MQKFFDPTQPQTLQIATFFLYFRAVFAVLGAIAGGPAIVYVIALACGGGAYGMANRRKWGYILAIIAACLPFLLPLIFGLGIGFILRNPVSLVLDVALLALVLHPQSRDYQRVWFS